MAGNNFTLMDGSLSNLSSQDVFHWEQNGITIGNGSNGAPIGHHIPASSALDGTDALGNSLTLPQDGKSFLDTGTKLKHRQMARVVQADSEEFWYDSTLEEMISKEHVDFIGVETSNKVFNDISEPYKVKNIRSHKAALTRKQLDGELKITNND